MGTTRLEAFSDGVIAIIITVMVLDMKVPLGPDISMLKPVFPIFMCYILSFIYLAIYWNNHHHVMYVTKNVNAGILWANMHFLFWLSLLPFVTGWMGENRFAPMPTALYGVVLFCAATAYFILVRIIIRSEGDASILKKAVGRDFKGKISIVMYAVGVASALTAQWFAAIIYVAVALIWLIPDRRIERAIKNGS